MLKGATINYMNLIRKSVYCLHCLHVMQQVIQNTGTAKNKN
jgi:hypothetical protein